MLTTSLQVQKLALLSFRLLLLREPPAGGACVASAAKPAAAPCHLRLQYGSPGVVSRYFPPFSGAARLRQGASEPGFVLASCCSAIVDLFAAKISARVHAFQHVK